MLKTVRFRITVLASVTQIRDLEKTRRRRRTAVKFKAEDSASHQFTDEARVAWCSRSSVISGGEMTKPEQTRKSFEIAACLKVSGLLESGWQVKTLQENLDPREILRVESR